MARNDPVPEDSSSECEIGDIFIKEPAAASSAPHHYKYVAPTAPDGGYGWVVVVVAFMIHVIVDGAAFGYGVVSNHIKEYYQCTESEATLVGSLQLGFYLLSCPVSGKMIERFGFHVVCVIGSVLSALGFSLSQFSPNIYVLMITYGVIAGTGFGMMYLSSISAVTLYFDKKRVLATGLATMGSGLGMFAFQAICGFLIDKYEWKSALLILGGICLEGCVFGMLLRPIETTSSNADQISLLGEEVRRTGEESGFESGDSSPRHASNEDLSAAEIAGSKKLISAATKPSHVVKIKRDIIANDYINSLASLHNIMPSVSVVEKTLEVQPDSVSIKSRSNAKEKCIRCTSHVIDLGLLKEPIFYIICGANIFAFLGAFIPLKFQVDRAMTFELSDSQERTNDMAAFLVSVSGIASTLGRGSSALLGVRPTTNKVLFHNIAVLVCGVACFFNVFCTTYPLMVTFACVFTFFFGIYIALSSVVVCEMLGPEAVNNAFALMCMLRGFANIAGGPIAGAAYDVLQDYDVCFYIGGAMVTMGALCFFLLQLPSIQARSFHTKVKQLDIDLDVDHMIASMVNVNNVITDNDKKLVASCISMSGYVNSRAGVDVSVL